jgi:hypothetical protein
MSGQSIFSMNVLHHNIKTHKIALTEAEMSAPGREISYLASVRRFANNKQSFT